MSVVVVDTIANPFGGSGDITGVTAGTALTGGGTLGTVTVNADVGTTANKLVRLDASAKLPAVDGSQLTNLPSGGGSSAGVAGSVQFSDGASGFSADDSQLFWNNASNRLGIGTDTPATTLDVNGTVVISGYSTTPSPSLSGVYLSASSDNPSFLLSSSPNSANSKMWDTILINGQDKLQFRAVNDGFTGARAWLTVSGGSGAITSINFPQGVVTMGNYGAGAATFDASGNISSVSDERLKEIQRSFTAGLTELSNIQPITFKWKEESGMETEHEYSGFSAQNVGANLKEAVGVNNAGFMSIQDRAIMAALVNAVNALRARVEELENEA